MEAQGAQSYIFSSNRPMTWNAAGINRSFGFYNFYMGDVLDATGLYYNAKWEGMGFSPFAPKNELYKEHTYSAQYISNLMLRNSIPPTK